MADLDFNLQSLHSDFQKAHKAVMSGSGSSSDNCAQKQAIAFGQQVKQTVPNDHLNNSIPCDEGAFHNPFCDSRFKKVPVTVIYSQEPHLGEPPDLPIDEKLQSPQSSNQSEIKIVQVWSMAVKKASNSVDNSHQNSNLMEQVGQIIPADNSSSIDVSQTVQTQESLVYSEAVAPRTNWEEKAHINKNVSTPSEKITDNKATRLERQRKRQRELRKDPIYVGRERERQRALRKDPAYLECEREHKRERRKDPVYAERERERARERQKMLRKDPAYAERQRERQRERYQNDPAYAEGRRIYSKTYNKIKRQTSNKEEASRLASIARKQYLQSVNSPQTSNPAEPK